MINSTKFSENNLENEFYVIYYILTIIIGISIGIIVGYFIFKKYEFKGPDSNIVSKETYIDSNGKKYKLIPRVCICPISHSMIKLKDPNFIDPNH